MSHTGDRCPERPSTIERRRAIRALFVRLASQVIWWDVIMNLPVLRVLRPPPGPRWRAMALAYRQSALRLNGVLIKVGQNVSARVDLFPAEITDILAQLQDRVSPAPFYEVEAQLCEDYGAPLTQMFASFDPWPIGSASLGQVHRALMPSGEAIVVKVLRPGVIQTVNDDLKQISRWLSVLNRIGRIRRHVDLEALMAEFSVFTRRELDLREEARASERFASDFADDPGVHVPRIHWALSNARALAMEDVSYFPIAQVEAYERLGVSRTAVARKLTDVYLDQIFRTGFVHADPHPGNLFVRPLPHAARRDGSREPWAHSPGAHVAEEARGFQLVFIDFGMFGEVPPRARAAMRTYALGVATRDADLIIKAYLDGDMLLPGAHLDQLRKVTQAMLERLPRAFLGQMRGGGANSDPALLKDYQKLARDSPFSFNPDMLLTFRAMGTCAGTVARIDPDFDPADCFPPLMRRLMMDDWRMSLDRAHQFLSTLLGLPEKIDRTLTREEFNDLMAAQQSSLRDRDIAAVVGAVKSLAFAVGGGAVLVSGILALSLSAGGSRPGLDLVAIGSAGLLAALLTRR